MNYYFTERFVQDTLSFNFNNVPLSEVFSQIEDLTAYTFFYKNEDVNLEKKITLNVVEKSLNQVLLLIFKDQDLSFKIVDNHIIINNESKYTNLEYKEDYIICKVIDKNTNDPISYATIRIKNTKVGVIADDNGSFRLPYHYKTNSDTLVITSIGYEKKIVGINNFKDKELNIITLREKIEGLESVILNAKTIKNRGYELAKLNLSGRQIVEKAIKNIPINFSGTPSSYIGYYRDYQIFGNEYYNLNEAILETFDAGIYTDAIKHSDNQTVLYSYKNNMNFKRDSLISIPYDNKKYKYIDNVFLPPIGGNELSILTAHNPIRNYNKASFSYIYVFKEDFLENHEFKVVNKLYLDDVQIYQIKFRANKNITGSKHTGEGTIFISPENNFSIYKLEYAVYEIKWDVNGYNTRYGSSFTEDIKQPIYSLKLEYNRIKNKMYLNYISFSNTFKVKDKNSFKMTDISFNQQENSLHIKFNNELDKPSAMRKKNFRFSYKKKKLNIKNIKITGDKEVSVSLVKGTLPDININANNNFELPDFKYRIKNIKDVFNRTLNKTATHEIVQYRELFVQEVFPQKKLSVGGVFSKKTRSLHKSQIVNNPDIVSKYWVNTPLNAIKK